MNGSASVVRLLFDFALDRLVFRRFLRLGFFRGGRRAWLRFGNRSRLGFRSGRRAWLRFGDGSGSDTGRKNRQFDVGQCPLTRKTTILVVDDNSPDGTAELARSTFSGEPRVRVIVRETDRGFARSILAGIEAAKGTRVLVMDSDFNHDPRVIPMMVGVSPWTDIVSGSRFVPGGNMQDRRRYLLSLAYNWWVRLMVRTQVQDNLCGYFLMDRAKLMELPKEAIFFGFGDYYFRLLHFAQKRGDRVLEIPIVVADRPGGSSKNRFLRTFWNYTREIVKLKTRNLFRAAR